LPKVAIGIFDPPFESFFELVLRSHEIRVSAQPKELLESLAVLLGFELEEDLSLFYRNEGGYFPLEPTAVRLAQLRFLGEKWCLGGKEKECRRNDSSDWETDHGAKANHVAVLETT
jgi:hypothetical protein